MRRHNTIFLNIIIILLFAGCSLDYREAAESDEIMESVPDVVLNRFIHTSVKGSQLVFQLEAVQAKVFNKKKYTFLTDVRFIEYDESGRVSLEGRATNALFYTDTENAEINGAIYGYSVEEKVAFYAETLIWDRENRILKSRAGEIVRIEKDDGSFIEGRSFSIDARRKTLNYEYAVHGKFVREEKNEEKR